MTANHLQRPDPLRRTIWLITFCLLGQIAMAQTVPSQDISQLMTPAEIGQSDQTIRDCLTDNSPGVLDSHYAYSSESGDSLQLIYSWQADNVQYVRYKENLVIFRRQLHESSEAGCTPFSAASLSHCVFR